MALMQAVAEEGARVRGKGAAEKAPSLLCTNKKKNTSKKREKECDMPKRINRKII